jgi:hypothetical protein
LDIAARRVVLIGVTFNSWDDYGWVNSAVRTRTNGDLQDVNGKVIGTVTKGVRYDRLTLDLPAGTVLKSIVGPADRNVCGTAVFVAEGVEVYN